MLRYKNAGATTYTWVGNSGNWNVQANWYNNSTNSTGHGYPGSANTSDIAYFSIYYPNSSNNTPVLTATLPFAISQVQATTYANTNITINNGATLNVGSVQALAYSGDTFTINTGGSLNVTDGLAITGTYGGTYDGVTITGGGSATLGGASTTSYYGSLTIGASTTVTFPAGSSYVATNTNNTVTNAGTLNFNGTSSSGVTMSFIDYGALVNTGTITGTYATIKSTGNSLNFNNSHSCTLTNSIVTIGNASGGQFGTLTNSGTFSATNTAFTFYSNSTGVANTKNFTLTTCPVLLNGQSSYLSNTTAAGSMILNGCAVTTSTQNTCNITNGASATFQAYGGSSITISSYQGYINNSGNFYSGATNNSTCPITLNSTGSYITNSGTFYVGSTSGITMSASSETTTNTGTFTFQSDQYGSAYAGQIPVVSSPPKFNGTYNVERYLTGGTGWRGYRMLSSPVYAGTANSNNVYSLSYLKNTCFLTGTTSTAGGFDQGPNPTLYLFRENLAPLYTTFLNSNFRGINKINATPTPTIAYTLDTDGGPYNIPVGNGYLFFFRGDKSAATLAQETTVGYVPVAATLTASGTLNQGSITYKYWYTPASGLAYSTTPGNTTVRGNNLVGNPYASSIDWETYGNTSTSGIYVKYVSKTEYTFNPYNKNYAAYTKGGGGIGSNGATNIIASGEGFFVVDTVATGGFITFNEAAKSNVQLVSGTTLLMGKPTDVAQMQYLRLQLAKDSINTDDMVVRFVSSASPAYVPDEDAPYRAGFGMVSLCSISSNNVDLAINELPLPKVKPDVIGLSVGANADGLYTLNLTQIVSIPALYDIWLMDAYKQDSLDMRHNPTYAFNVLKSDTNSFGSKRFSLVIRQNTAYAYHLLDFTAAKTAAITQVQIVWKTENEGNYTNFTVERSTDGGKTYEVIGSQTASDQGTYSLLDKAPINGQNLYRLKQVDMNGTVTYSQIIPVMYSDKSNSTWLAAGKLNVYPNPATSLLNLTIADTSAASYQITITSSTGALIKQATSAQSTWETAVSNLIPGTYLIQVVDNKDKSLIGKTKFVKL